MAMEGQSAAIQREELIEFVADIVSAYVSKNPVQQHDLPHLIETVHGSMATLAVDSSQAEPLTPAVPVRSSVKKDHIVCLECGKKFSSLKRHIGTRHGLTPEEYRAKWSLPRTYPMVAQTYSNKRSQLAVRMGLGHKLAEGQKKGRRKAR